MNNGFSIEQVKDILERRHRYTVDDHLLPRAAVLLGLYETTEDFLLVFTKRTNLVAHHKGEICFPGGRQHVSDPTMEFTALRETFEEIGVRPEDVRLLGKLDDIETISGFVVTPFVGQVCPLRQFITSPDEVEELLQVPLSHLRDTRNQLQEFVTKDGMTFRAPTYKYGHHIIWGATARILHQFLGLTDGLNDTSI